MKRRWIMAVIAVNLAGLIALVFIFPHLMISPGPVVAAHADIGTDCFACHAPWRGISPARCQACHAIAAIGVTTSKGQAIAGAARMPAFHQQLRERNCVACHSDHAGPRLTGHASKPFAHSMLEPATRSRCDSCHARPGNRLHASVAANCGQCHRTDAWKPAVFDHRLLAPQARAKCESCHAKPKDGFHRGIQGNCQQCHRVSAWKPSTFDHNRYFALQGDHDAPCATCHLNNDLTRYTCYGCHEHRPARIIAEHAEEGIRDTRNCVRCHRSAHGEGEEGGDDDD